MATVETIGDFRRNLAFRTEDIGNAYWTKSNCAITGGADDPDGGTTGDTAEDTASGSHGYYQRAFSGLTHGTKYCWSLYFKKDTATQVRLRIAIQGGTTEADMVVDIDSSGVAEISGTAASTGTADYALRPCSSIYSDPSGWYRAEGWLEYDNTEGGGSADVLCEFYVDTVASSTNQTTVAWHQFEEGEYASVYQPQLTGTDAWTGDYTTIAAWLAAHNNEDMVTGTVQYDGKLLTGTHVVDADTLEALNSGGNTSATYYRRLTWNDEQYKAREHTGPRVVVQWVDNTSAQEGLRITEDFFRIDGVGFFCEDPRDAGGSGSVDRPCIKVDGADDFLMIDSFVRVSESSNRSTNPTDYFLGGVLVDSADNARFYNCSFLGGSNGFGGTYAILYQSTSTNGGIYGCGAYRFTRGICRGFMTLRTTSSEQELLNSIAIDCHANGGLDFSGTWGRKGYNITSDGQAESIYAGGTTYDADGNTQVGVADANSFVYVSALHAFTRPDSQDFHPPNNHPAEDGGRDESTQYTSNIGDAKDQIGEDREVPWSIGPIEEAGSPPTSRPIQYEENIGSNRQLRHFANVQAWLTATEGISLYSRNEVRRGLVHNDAGPVNIGADTLKLHRTVGAAGRYRDLKGADGRHAWNPTLGAGAWYKGSSEGTDYTALIYIREEFARVSRIRFEQTSTSSSDRQCVVALADCVELNALSLDFDGGTGSDSLVCLVRGRRSMLTNVLAIGGGASAGAAIGFRLEDAILVRVFNCVAHNLKQGTAKGFHEDSTAERCAIENSIGADCDTCFAHDTAANAGVTQSHNISTDATADGPESQASVSLSSIFVDAANGNYRLPATSVALNAGKNLKPFFSTDFLGVQRTAPFDVGIFEGVGSTLVVGSPAFAYTDDIHRCLLVEIVRRDGTAYYYTDANMAMPHGGRTYVPQQSVALSAMQREASLGENSLEASGMISTDIDEDDLRAGLFDDAEIIVRVVDSRQPWRTPVATRRARFSPAEYDEVRWRSDALGLAAKLAEPVGELIEQGCDAVYGSERCGHDTTSETVHDVRVDSVSDTRRKFRANSSDLASTSDDYYNATDDNLVWLSGDNVGTVSRVKDFDDGNREITLAQPTGKEITTSDTFRIVRGCLKRYLADCVDRGNGPNFRGSPFLVGPDDAFKTLDI